MSTTVSINPRYEALVLQHGLDRFDLVMNWPNARRVSLNAMREICRIELDAGDRKIRLYLKREWGTYAKDRIANWLEGIGWGTKSGREWRAINALSTAGVGCAEALVVAQRGKLAPQGYLVLREVPGAVDLCTYLFENGREMDVYRRRQLAAHLGREVARLHEAGVDHPDLFSKHILLATPAQPPDTLPEICFIDLQRSRSGHAVTARRRAIDLAALDATVAPELASATDRLAFLQSYLSTAPAIPRDRLIRAIERRRRRIQGRRKIRRMRELGRPRLGESHYDGHPTAIPFQRNAERPIILTPNGLREAQG
jgi:tRNA A-37 threonylcarbamoyl transferase component Bud32